MTFKNYKKKKQKQHQEFMKQASQEVVKRIVKVYQRRAKMTREEKVNTLKAIIQECEEYQWWRKATLSEIIEDLEQDNFEDEYEPYNREE